VKVQSIEYMDPLMPRLEEELDLFSRRCSTSAA